MRVPPRPGELSRKAASLAETLERLRATLDLEPKAWAELLQMTTTEYDEVIAGRRSLSVVSLAMLTEHLDLSMEAVVNGNVDYQAAAARFMGNLGYVPERYLLSANSKRRTTINLLNYVEDFLGWESRRQILRYFNLAEAVFADPDAPINILFHADVCEYLRRYKSFDQDDFFAMGAYSVVTNCTSQLAEILSTQESPSELYRVAIEELVPRYFENNHLYRITDLSKTKCVIESRANPEVLEAFKTERLGNPDSCATRMGVGASLLGYRGLPFADTRETACVHRGDAVCRIEFDYEAALGFSKSDSFRPPRTGNVLPLKKKSVG